MEQEEKIIEKRAEKITSWIKDPHNLFLVLIIVLAIAIRLYYFILVKNQPLWWDEAEYMNMAKHWALGTEYLRFDVVRPVLFSLVNALFFKISPTEFLPRIFMLSLSIASVIIVYYFGKEVYNKKVGLIACFMMSVFYLNLFFSYRLQMDVPSLTFFTFSAYFFYKYFKNSENHKALYWASALIAIGTMFKQNTAFLLFGVGIYILITEKLKFLKKKEIWIAVLIFLLVLSPYLIWGNLKYGGFVLTKGQGSVAPQNFFSIGFNNLHTYLTSFPYYLSWIFLVIFLLGIVSMYKLFLGFDILIKRGDKNLKRDLFLILILISPIILISFLINHAEERYIINAFPTIFIISGFIMLKGYNKLKKYNKIFALIILIGLLGFFAYFQTYSAGHTDDLIKSRTYSYLEIKNAGLWFKENTEPNDIIMSQSIHQIEYYSDRKAEEFLSLEEFEALKQENENLKYFMISTMQKSRDWSYSYPQENNLTLLNAYFADAQQTQPLVLIYKI
jgi:4-amino-4-deoxy-L-arabinose transferase-like glycosyltransferase